MIPDQPKIDNIPPGMDFRQLPIEMLTTTLRDWAQNLVTKTLNIGTPFDVHTNELQTLLPYLRPQKSVLPKKRIKILTGFSQAAVDKIMQNPVALTIVQNQQFVTTNYLPEPLWPLIGAMAWDDSVFQTRLATEIAAVLRTRFLFLKGELPQISLRPEVFWLIIALLKTPSQVTRQCYQRSNWAGFWEQWLLMELLQHSIIQINVLEPALKDLLIGLPILSLPNYGELKKKLLEKNTEKSGKFSQLHKYLTKLAHIFRTNKAQATLPDIVDKAWRDALPSWFTHNEV